jgi:hypothetical protein
MPTAIPNMKRIRQHKFYIHAEDRRHSLCHKYARHFCPLPVWDWLDYIDHQFVLPFENLTPFLWKLVDPMSHILTGSRVSLPILWQIFWGDFKLHPFRVFALSLQLYSMG